jgi:hypothetical protein
MFFYKNEENNFVTVKIIKACTFLYLTKSLFVTRNKH